MLATAILLAAIASAAVEAAPTQECERKDINKVVDFVMELPKHIDIEERVTIQSLEDTSLSLPSGEAEARNVTLLGVDSLQRSGNCFICKYPDSSLLEVELGFSFLELITGRLTLSKDALPFAASFTLHGPSMKLVISGIGKAPIVDKVELLTLGGKVKMSASNPDYDGKDVTDIAREFVLPAINDKLEQMRQECNKHMDSMNIRMVFQQLLS